MATTSSSSKAKPKVVLSKTVNIDGMVECWDFTDADDERFEKHDRILRDNFDCSVAFYQGTKQVANVRTNIMNGKHMLRTGKPPKGIGPKELWS